MMQRWLLSIKSIPKIDLDQYVVDKDQMKKTCDTAEFCQQAYVRMRYLEEMQVTNHTLLYYKDTDAESKTRMTTKQRLYGIMILKQLYSKKGYPDETFFLAVDIFDRFFAP